MDTALGSRLTHRLDDLLVRREKTDRVTDLVNLDRVRGLLRTVYWRKRFLVSRDERRRTLNAQAEGIPAIVLEPTPASPPLNDDPNPFHDIDISRSPSPSNSRTETPSSSPDLRTLPHMRSRTQSPDLDHSTLGDGYRHSPSLSVTTLGGAKMSRRTSDISMLSEEDAHRV